MIMQKIKTILSNQFDVDEEKITEDTHIVNDLGAGSLEVVDILMSLEDEFDIEIPDEDVEKINTVEDILEYIEAAVDAR